jgi:hypothetical protein
MNEVLLATATNEIVPAALANTGLPVNEVDITLPAVNDKQETVTR